MSKLPVKSSKLHSFIRKGLDHSPCFDSRRDVEEVKSGLAVDVTDMLKTGVVRDSSGDMSNNGIDDPANVIGLVRDEFAAIDAQRAIRKYGKKAAQAAKEATQVGAPAPSGAAASPDLGKSE